MFWTTYCMKHEVLETVDEVTKVRPFMVEAKDPITGWGVKTGRAACEVWGVTDAGCKVRFYGGPKWSNR